MMQLIYTPKSLEALRGIKDYIARQFGTDKAECIMKEITSTAKQLELFPEEGSCLKDLIDYSTDYHYLIIRPNYVFYRIENDTVRIIRVLNERQDFFQTFFGVSSISDDGEDYWSQFDL